MTKTRASMDVSSADRLGAGLGPIRITRIHITPVAFEDPPLLNAIGVHEPYALRSIIQVETDAGLTGLGESYGNASQIQRIRTVADAVVGLDVFGLGVIYREAEVALNGAVGTHTHGLTGRVTARRTIDEAFAALEVALLDIQGKCLGRPVSDLLGGALRTHVAFSGYLFYKWAGHADQEADRFGEALDPQGIVAQARWMVEEFGFTALKLKGGVFAPDEEIAAIRALRTEFPDAALRMDPNGAWTVETSIRVGKATEGLLEYLEDPTESTTGMSKVARSLSTPLATNMCVVGFEDLRSAIALDAVSVILCDHHFWGGLRRSKTLAGICDAFGLGFSMHSTSHLGISLASMLHLASTVPDMQNAMDTHWPWRDVDVVSHQFEFVDGAVRVPTTPGLGVELDEAALGQLHDNYVRWGAKERNDTRYMQSIEPGYDPSLPRW